MLNEEKSASGGDNQDPPQPNDSSQASGTSETPPVLQSHNTPASQGDALQGYRRKFPIPKVAILGIVFLFLFALVAGAYFLGKNSANQTSTAPTVSQTPTPASNAAETDPKANWKTYTSVKLGFSLKHPANWGPKKCPEGFKDSICSEIVAETANETEPLFYFIYFNEDNPPDSVPGVEKINYREETINNIQVLRTFDLPSRSGAESVFFKRNGNKYMQIGFTPYDNENPLTFTKQGEHHIVFNQILSTFKFTQ